MDWTAFEPQRSATPLYRQVYGFVRAAIETGKLKPGDGLPSEQGLADAMGVSYDTVRKALQLLRDDGHIETATGIGSFVAGHQGDGQREK
jgi:DNA-binding GntR family transcriptional regulator